MASRDYPDVPCVGKPKHSRNVDELFPCDVIFCYQFVSFCGVFHTIPSFLQARRERGCRNRKRRCWVLTAKRSSR